MTEVPTQPQSQPTKQGINWKNILIGAIIGAVLVGIIGGLVLYLYQSSSEETTPTTTPKTSTPSAKIPTPSAEKDETADWDTYLDSTNGVSFKYPTNWVENHAGSDKVMNPTLANYKGPAKEGLDVGMAKIQYNGKFSYKEAGFNNLSDYLNDKASLTEGDTGYSPYTAISNVKTTKLGVNQLYLANGFGSKNAYLDIGSGNAISLYLYANPLKDFEDVFETALSTLQVK